MTTKELQLYNKNKALDIKQAAWNSLAEESKKAYQSDFNIFFEYIQKQPKDVTANDILSFIEHLENQGYKNTSINRKIASLSKMFKTLIIAGEIKTNPVDTLKQFKNISRKTSREVRITLTITDIRKATKITKQTTENDKKIILIVRTLAKSGLRISELTGIKNKDISEYNDKHKTIRIVGKGRKERFIFLENEFINEIKKTFPEDNEYLFYSKMRTCYNRKWLWREIKDLFYKRIKKDVHPHLLRHAYITHKISVEKMDIKAVSRYSGHENISTTLDMYVDKALNVNESKIKI